MAQSAHESYWNHQRDTLNRVRSRVNDGGGIHSGQSGFEPLKDNHRLLAGSQATRVSQRGRHSRTPPAHLPRMETPPEHKHESRVRGVKFDVLPHVQHSYNNHDDGSDSWGEDESDDEAQYPQYPHLPYSYPGSKLPMPVVMYPMILPPQPAPRKHKGKKRVRMRNSPVYLNSRDNTLHTPNFIHNARHTGNNRSYDTYDGGGYAQDSAQFDYIAPQREDYASDNYGDRYDPFDPHLNPVLARYSVNVDREQSPSFSKHYRQPKKYEKRQSPLVRHSEPAESYTTLGRDLAIESFVEEFIHSELDTSMLRDVVTSAMEDYVTEYMSRAAIYDVAADLVTEIIEDEEGADIAAEALVDVFLEDWLEAEVLKPEVEEMSHEITVDVCNNYNDKRRQRDIRQIKKDFGDKVLESLCLDYMLLLLARQGRIWTETEHVNKYFDGLIIELLLEQLVDVTKERRNDINNKPVRRHHEKMVTDVAVDVLLEELAPTLDEDMADLDEYEMGMQFGFEDQFRGVDSELQGL